MIKMIKYVKYVKYIKFIKYIKYTKYIKYIKCITMVNIPDTMVALNMTRFVSICLLFQKTCNALKKPRTVQKVSNTFTYFFYTQSPISNAKYPIGHFIPNGAFCLLVLQWSNLCSFPCYICNILHKRHWLGLTPELHLFKSIYMP